jgi:hypothetical protein
LEYPGLLFLWQRWLEALDNTSQVSVQAPTTGALAILREWLDLKSRQSQEAPHAASALIAVEDEAFGRKQSNGTRIGGTLPGDSVLKAWMEVLLPESKSLRSSHTGESAAENIIEERRVASAHQLEAWMVGSYLDALVSDLEGVVFPVDVAKNPDGQASLRASEVAQIDALVTAMVSHALSQGFSTTFLRRHARILVLPSEGQSDERSRFRTFVKRLGTPQSDTVVIIKVQAGKEFWAAWPSTSDFEHAATLGGLEKSAKPDDASFAQQNQAQSVHFVKWTGAAMDRPSATVLAVRAFERVCDLVWAKDPSIPDPLLLEVGTIRKGAPHKIVVVPMDHTEAVFRPPRHSAARQARPFAGKTAHLAAVSSANDGTELVRSRQRIASALRASRASTGQRWTENRIATLWTAVEVLAHERYGPHVIERVVRSVVPFAVAGKVRDLTDDVAQYLLTSNVGEEASVKAAVGDVLSQSSTAGRASLLGRLSDPAIAQTVIHASDRSPLVGWRVEEFQKVTASGKTLAARVRRSAQRVDWQLRRIYRHRNDYLHGGRLDLAADRLHEHLYLYAMTMLDPVAKALLGPAPAKSLEEVIASLDARVQEWLEWMQRLTTLVKDLNQDDLERLYTPPIA